ncbi:acyl-CoA N-acyltransferase [Mycena floridula]|nr:acyl-CoA N-acyltransferase [Mycena floridula]
MGTRNCNKSQGILRCVQAGNYAIIDLVPPSEAEDEAVALLRAHPETLRYLPILPAKFTVADARERRERQAKLDNCFRFHIHVGDKAVFGGTTGLHTIEKESNSCHNVGTEALYLVLEFAFETRGLHRATFGTGVNNVRMRGWLEKIAGIRLEGIMRDAWKHTDKDVYYDMASYSILEGEWRDGVKERLRARLNR